MPAGGALPSLIGDKAMRIVLCGDFLFSGRNLVEKIDPKLVELLQSAEIILEQYAADYEKLANCD